MSQSSLRVMIVEDSEFDALILVNVLRKGEYKIDFTRVETAGEMTQALDDGPWDLILADYNLPHFSAPDALKLLQQSGHDIPFIIISGGIGEDIAVASMKAGAHDYLMKGHLARLVPAVEREIRDAAVRAARRKAEQAVRESEQRYRLLWETATDAIILMDTDSVIRFANPAVEKIFGYHPYEIVGQNVTLLLPERVRPDDQKNFRSMLLSGIRASERHVLETVGWHKDNREVLIEIAYNDMELKNERWFVAFVRDITERKRAERELREKQEQLRIASEIQQSLFPKEPPPVEELEVAGRAYPAADTGGDYFDFLEIINGKIGFVTGDVTGHGVGPALLMADCRAYLRILARNREDPGTILTRANHVLAADVGPGRFVTLILVIVDPITRQLTYSSAGHTPGFVISSAGEIRATLKRTGKPLGLKSDTSYETSQPIQLESGDLILLGTDGIEEAMSPDDEFFGRKRMLETVCARIEQPVQDIVESLYQSVREFSAYCPQEDDVTVVLIRVK